jgi:hypothetical protein
MEGERTSAARTTPPIVKRSVQWQTCAHHRPARNHPARVHSSTRGLTLSERARQPVFFWQNQKRQKREVFKTTAGHHPSRERGGVRELAGGEQRSNLASFDALASCRCAQGHAHNAAASPRGVTTGSSHHRFVLVFFWQKQHLTHNRQENPNTTAHSHVSSSSPTTGSAGGAGAGWLLRAAAAAADGAQPLRRDVAAGARGTITHPPRKNNQLAKGISHGLTTSFGHIILKCCVPLNSPHAPSDSPLPLLLCCAQGMMNPYGAAGQVMYPGYMVRCCFIFFGCSWPPAKTKTRVEKCWIWSRIWWQTNQTNAFSCCPSRRFASLLLTAGCWLRRPRGGARRRGGWQARRGRRGERSAAAAAAAGDGCVGRRRSRRGGSASPAAAAGAPELPDQRGRARRRADVVGGCTAVQVENPVQNHSALKAPGFFNPC